MIYATVSAYLIAMRAWFDCQRRAAMRNEPFHEPTPEYQRADLVLSQGTEPATERK